MPDGHSGSIRGLSGTPSYVSNDKKNMADCKPIPVIDLFAGPGGLGEGFSSLTNTDGTPAFDLRVSIEKDFHAHQTLSLRALFRHFAKGKAPDCYYDYVKKRISRDALFAHPEAKDAGNEALNVYARRKLTSKRE